MQFVEKKIIFGLICKIKLFLQMKRVPLQTSFRSASFFIPKKMSPLCVGKAPTDHFFNEIADTKITLLFNAIYKTKVCVFLCFCLNNDRQTPDLESDDEQKWE